MAAELQQLTTGKYLFFGSPYTQEGQNLFVIEFKASAVGIHNDASGIRASVQDYNISPLLSKTSSHVLEEKIIEAHKLYTWPANLGDPKAWAASKQSFFEQHLINHPIEIMMVLEEQHITWKFIPLSDFKAEIEEAQATSLLSDIFPNL
ncbi:hypothetical protein [Pedobacter gandavensis]|uniref:hypothetical protein n=1 Tax=Pedobacter gandavensis TaxID=2679963 RepID=UPI002931A2CF|nr:hypothetical protein [Pedobacter gandavensis]